MAWSEGSDIGGTTSSYVFLTAAQTLGVHEFVRVYVKRVDVTPTKRWGVAFMGGRDDASEFATVPSQGPYVFQSDELIVALPPFWGHPDYKIRITNEEGAGEEVEVEIYVTVGS